MFEQQDSAPFRSFARPIGLAEPEAVVIAAGTRRLIGDLFEYRDLGAVEVKGIAAPVPASQVLGPSAVTSRFAALRGSALTPLVGRDEEIDLLLRRWARAKAGDGQVVLVSGEPGIGKSRLAAAAARPVAAVAGRGHPRQSLWPWVAEDREADRALPVVIDPPDRRRLGTTRRALQVAACVFFACRRKLEMTPGAQSRDDTRVGGGHDERDLDCVRSEGEQRI